MSLYAKKDSVIAARPFEPGLDDKLVPEDANVLVGDMVTWDPKNESEKRVMSLGEFEALYVALHHADDDRPRSPEEAKKIQAAQDAERKRLAEEKAKQDAIPAVQTAKGPASPSGDSRPGTDLGTAHGGIQGAKDSNQVKGEDKK